MRSLHRPRLLCAALGAAFGTLLASSGTSALAQASPAPVPADSSTETSTTLPVVRVTGKAPVKDGAALQREGDAKDGYKTKTVSSVGALGSVSLQDTPFAISVLPLQLLENLQAQSPDDLFKLTPSSRSATPQGTGWTPVVNIRGFDGSNTAEDGLRRIYNHAAVLEDKERVEVLSGLSGFLFGAASPGGMVNYVYKRPTTERLNSVTVGNYGGSQWFVHGDFGGMIDSEGQFGYRLNLVKQDGETSVDQQKINRSLVSGALDWHITDQLLLELNGVYNKYHTDGPSAYWFYDAPHGKAPDADKLWGQPWVQDEFENTKLMGKLSYKLNDQLTLRGAYMRDNIDRPKQDHAQNYVGDVAAGYEQIGIRSGRTKDRFDAAQAMADLNLDTGSVQHKLTLGYAMYQDKYYATTFNPNTGWMGPFPLDAPHHIAEPTFPEDTTEPVYAAKVRNSNWLIGDQVRFTEQWSALLGISHSSIVTSDYDFDLGKVVKDYDKSRNSPSVSLIFKPMPWLTTYATYIEGLEQGGTAPETAANANAVMQPMVSEQKEIGIKADLGGMLLTGALFDIEKAYEFLDDDNVYRQDGRQRHRGIELGATGKATSDLTVFSGFTWLAPKVHGGALSGLQPINVAKVLAKVYAEYQLRVIPGLSLNGGVFYTGKQWANDGNTDRLPAYTTLDLGLRYTTTAASHPVTLNLYASNVTNKSYWQNSYYVGSPRNVAFSANVKF
ncbi:MAG TPA: TonB-dependent siderophore receptor [Ideonella sp.]|uniref:TonB-dependent siderophore receptor n=1 Tax=Ideonella sp. TaxID=1929293 RepID=UPI002BA512E6|nr:TonB-dependent siderophore receptor [Ideonella sp.]HSI49078.1 TonB-dependent siderophore receptor [Ideonella sp.]